MEKIEVAIILVNYNGYNDTIECINSIKKNEEKLEYKVIVVDNCSTNESVVELKKQNDIVLITSDINNGFSAGNNIGIKYVLNNLNARFILLLNNDTIIEKNAISNMIKNMEEKDQIGIVTCKLMNYYKRDELDCCGGYIDYRKVKGNFNYFYMEENKYYSELATGACMLIPIKIIKKIGFLDEEYFMYFEDLDYSARIRQSNYKIQVVLDSIIYHKGGASTNGVSPFAIKWNTRNRIVFYKKYKNNVNKIYFLTHFCITRIIYIIKYLCCFKYKELIAMFNGIILGIKYKNK